MEQHLNLIPICSYTTRAKRATETEGKEHYFITPEVAKEKLANENILAYTKIGDIEYFATYESLLETGANLYIIDPLGVQYLKDHLPDELELKVIYIHLDEEKRMERAKSRDNEDFYKNFKFRNEKEDAQFTEFENEKGWDYKIENNTGFEASVWMFINRLVQIERMKKSDTSSKRIMYCVVGRTGSGKDSIVSKARELLESFTLTDISAILHYIGWRLDHF